MIIGYKKMLFAGLLSLLLVLPAYALQPPSGLLLHLPFDGSLENRGSAPDDGELIAEGGELAPFAPRFTEGRFGQAIQLTGSEAVRIPFDLSYEFYPKITITAWLYREGEAHGYVFSNRSASGPSLSVTGGGSGLSARGPAAEPREGNVLPAKRWTLIASVWDTRESTLSLHYDDKTKTVPLGMRVDPAALDVWIGAWDDALQSSLENIRVDDFRIYDRALTPKEIARLAEDGTLAASEESAATGRVAAAHSLDEARVSEPADRVEDSLGLTGRDESAPVLDMEAPASATSEPTLIGSASTPATGLKEEIASAETATPSPVPVDEIDCVTLPSAESPGLVEQRGDFPQKFVSSVRKLLGCNEPVTVAALNEADQWIVASSSQIAHSKNLPGPLAAKLQEFESRFGGLDAADIGEDGSWLISSGVNYAFDGLPSSARTEIDDLDGRGTIRSFDLHPDDSTRWILVRTDGAVRGPSLPDPILKELSQQPLTHRRVYQVRYGADDSWMLLASGLRFVSKGVDDIVLDRLRRSRWRTNHPISHIVFTDMPGEFMKISNGLEPMASNDPIQAIEQNVAGSSIWARMTNYNLAAVSIAMVRNNQVAWARAYGLQHMGDPESYMHPDTAFHTASLSKPVAAFAAMQLVEEGKMSLTAEGILEDTTTLLAWPNRGAYRDRIRPEASNLAQVLQHCASICYDYADRCANDGSGGGAAEYSVTDTLPTIAQMLRGTGPASAGHRPVRTGNPGIDHEYTSANYMLVQALIEVHSGNYENRMRQLLLDLAMTHSTFESPYPGRNSGNFARGWNGTSVTNVVAYGETAAAGLVSTPADYAKFVIAVNRNGAGLLSKENLDRYLGRDSSALQFCNDAGSMAMGIRRVPQDGRWGWSESFSHDGFHNGYRTWMFGLPELDSGLVVFMTGAERAEDPDPTDDARPPLKADQFFGELRRAVVATYGM